MTTKKKQEPQLNIADIHARIDLLMDSLRDLSDIHLRLGKVLGRELDLEIPIGVRSDLMPTINASDKDFLKSVESAANRKGYLNRMLCLQQLASKCADDAMDCVRKLSKLNERIKLQTEDCPERTVLLKKRAQMETVTRVLAYRSKLCCERWAHTRRMLFNAVLGMTEKMYASIGDVTCRDSLEKYPVSAIFDSINGADAKEKKKGRK